MNNCKKIIPWIIIGIFCINILIIVFPINKEGFSDSKAIVTELLKGIGISGNNEETFHAVPALLGTAVSNYQIDKTSHPEIRAGIQSEYSVPGWADTRWKFRKNITIDNTKVDGDLINFPVLIDLYDTDLQIEVQASGDDIIFTNASGIQLDHEIEFFDRVFNSTHAHLAAWVRTNLSSTQDTMISMYYGNPAVSSQENPEGVWDNDFVGVWHLAEDPTGVIYDSSSSGNDGTSVGGMTSDDQVKGPIDGCLNFDGIDDYIDTGNDSSLDLTDDITIQFWVTAENYVNDPDMLTKGSYTQAYSSFIYDANDDNSDGVFYFKLNDHNLISTSILNTGTWYSFVGTREGNTMRIYINGLEDATNTYSTAIETIIDPLTLARSPDNLNGTMDEVRLSNVARSSDWIATEYNNQFDADSFYSIGTKESYSVISWANNMYRYRKNVTIKASEVSGELTDFPVLLELFDTDLHNSEKVQPEGNDIIFVGASGSRLAHEIESFNQTFNSTHAHLVVWINVPSLSNSQDTTISMYYGNPAVSSQENPEGVWDNDYVGVWHLGESSGDTQDSTLYTAAGTSYSSVTQGVSGLIANASDFAGVTNYNNRIDMGDQVHLDFGDLDDFSIEFWLYLDSYGATNYQFFVIKREETYFGSGYGVGINCSSGVIALGGSDTNDIFEVHGGTSIVEDTWYHVVAVFDQSSASNTTIYLNGLEDKDFTVGTISNVNSLFNSQPFKLGHYFMDGYHYPLDGRLDEIRISNSVRSSAWVNTSYTNQYDPMSFYSVGIEEINQNWWADSSFVKRKDIIIDHTKVSANLTNFPVLISFVDTDLKTGNIQPDANDLLFIDENGNKLAHEVEFFTQNSSYGELTAWVCIPSLSNISDTIITIYFGNQYISSQENPSVVWISDFEHIWHLEEASGNHHDSVTGIENGQIHGTVTQNANGKIGGADELNGLSTESWIEVSGSEILTGDSPFTLEAWIYLDSLHSTYIGLVQKGRENDLDWIGLWLDDNNRNNFGWDWHDGRGGNVAGSTFSASQWYHVIATFDGTNRRLYLDGILDGGPNTGWYNTISTNWSIGTDFNGNYFDGVIDEVRISSIARSPEWIETTYNNTNDPSAFYSVGSLIERDVNPPVINDFGVDDLGTGTAKFWADITDDSGINSVEVTINNTKYTMSWNGTYWVYDFSVEFYQGYYEYLVTNASDFSGNYRTTNSSLKDHTFNKDTVDPNVLDWEYYDTLGPYGTFKANITDSWGVIDTVRVNVTTYNMQALMGQYTTYGGTIFAYMNNTLEMPNGLMDFQIIVNDTAGNDFVSSTHQGDVFSNHPPIVENLTLSPAFHWSNCSLTLTYDYYDEDGHGEVGTEIRWYKKNDSVFLLEPTYNDTLVIPASALEVGDQWYVNVTPKDGGIFGETNMSAIITILNTPPSVSDVVVFFSGADPYTTSTLNLDYTYDDHEGDAEDTNNREVEWFRNSIHNSTLDNCTSVSPGNTTKGDTWYYRIRVYDGTDYSSWVTSDSVIIRNSLPQAVNLTLPSNPTTLDDLVAEWDMADADGDIEDSNAVIIYWYKDGGNQSAWVNLVTIGAGNTSKGESWRFEIRVYDGENYSALTPLNPPVVILNSAPTVSNVELTPTTPVTTDGLMVTWDYSDDDNDPEGTPLIKWYLENMYQPAYDGETTLPASATTKGDRWHVGIQVFDGTAYSAEGNSSQVIIQNTSPDVNNLALTAALKTTTDLMASWDATDNDTGDSLTFNITWYLEGQVNCSWLTLASSATLTAGNTTKGDNWSFTIQAYDGEVYSSITSLGYNRAILNTAPVVANLTLTSNPTTTDALLATFDYSDADPADNTSLVFNITWYRNGLEQGGLANTTSIGSGNTTKSQFWWFTVQAYDGENFSLTLESAHVQILNTAPDIDNLVITPPSPTTTTDLNASWDDMDADNDALTYTVRWYIVGVGLQSAYNDLPIIPASATSKGQTWYYNLTAFDGDAYSLEKSSSQVVILNSPPEIDSLDVTPNPTTTDDLTASWSATDNDTGDSLTFNVTWYLNGAFNSSWLTSASSAPLTAGNTTKAQKWNVTVQAYDGETYSNILSLATNITILNSKPIVENPSFNDTSPDVADNFHITYTFVDADAGDSENLSKIIVYWYVNWNYNASFQNQTTIYGANTTATEVWYYIVRVFDGETYSDNVTSEQGVYIGGGGTNTRPMAIDLTLVPASPQTHEALIANYTFSDGDADPQVAYEIRWYLNSGTGFQLQPQYNNLFIVPASATSKGQEWNFTAKVFDGIEWSELNISSTLTIANTNPEVSNTGITSSPKTTDDLIASWVSSDNDSDSLTFIITWYLNGIENSTLANASVIEAGNTTKGEKWYFTVQAYDGEGLSSVISLAANVTILNTAPVASNLTITASPTTLDDLVAAWDYYDIDNDPRDDASAWIYWFKNGLNQTTLANQKTVGSSNTSKNQVWWFTVQVFDGENYSIATYESAHIQILNSIPVVENLETSISNPKTTDELDAQWDDTDNDSDILSYTIRWYIVGVGLQSVYNDLQTVPASATSKGETWYYTLKAFDGSDYSSEETLSPGVLILNTVPVVDNLALTMVPQTTDDLVASWTSSDNDSDSLTFIIIWYLNGTENSALANASVIEAGNTTKGEKWYFTVQAYDGEGLSSVISLAANVTILNTAPLANNLDITVNPTTLDNLVADWDYFDIDNDPRDDASARINWFKNGENQTALANQKTVGSTNTSKDQVWWFTVQIFDGESFSLLIYESAHVNIHNSAPYNSSALPLPTDPTKANGLVLNLSAISDAFYDPDPSDDIDIVNIHWYKGGELQSDLNSSLTVPGTQLTKGEVWNYSIVPFDGIDYGLVYFSAEIEVLNSKPNIINTYFMETEVTTISNLVISFQAEDADGDNITISGVRWYRWEFPSWQPNNTYDDYVSLPAVATTKGESWKFELEVSDGTDQSVWRETAKEADIINSKPYVDPFSIILTGGTTTSDPLQVSYTWYDADPGDSNSQTIITWENSGDYLDDTYSTTLSADNTTAGEKWWVTITPYDGEEYGDYVNSKRYGISIIIGNTPPTLAQEDIEIKGEFNGTEYQGTSFGTVFNLNLHYTAFDLDGEQGVPAYGLSIVDGFASGSAYRWYRNRSGVIILISALNDETTVPFYYTEKGDTWWVQVRPRDFYGDFGAPQNSSQITIGNTAPQIAELHWVRLTYYTTNDLSFGYTFFDHDAEDTQQGFIIQWYRNGTYLPEFDNNTTISSQFTRKNETWHVNLSVFDGESYSIWYQLLNITIQNSAPTVTTIFLTPNVPNTTQPLIATWTFNDVDNDSENQVAALIQWYRNGILVDSLMNSSTVPFVLTNREESWYFMVQVTDGYNYSLTSYQSDVITIINSAPIAFDLQINEGSIDIDTLDDLVLSWNFTDFDPLDIEDKPSVLILWYLDGVEQSAFTNLTVIPASSVVKGQRWNVSIKVCDNGGLWSEFLHSSLVVINNSIPTITIHGTAHPEFIIEDEALEINESFYSYTDADGDANQPVIAWYRNEELMYQNIWVILGNNTLPGDVWYYTIQPFDGTDYGAEHTSPEISIESRPVIHSFSATALPDTEGHYALEINVTDSHNEIKQVEFLLALNATTELSRFIITSSNTLGSSLWLLDYALTTYTYLETPTHVTVTVVTEVTYSITYEIYLIQTFTFTLEDKAPPRVLNAYFEMNDELNPTNLTFYAEVQDFGSGIAEVILSYYFKPSGELNQTGGNGAALLQDDLDWLEAPMTVQVANETGNFILYMVTVDFIHGNSNLDIIYRISTEDQAGNSNPFAFDIQDYPDRIDDQRFIYQPPGLPEWILLVAGLVVFVIFIGSIVYVKFIRKPELVGLDKELVISKISDITGAEVMESLDAHTIGVVVSFFDQRHGPIPIIVLPEMLKDNFNKLVDLSDRSFSGTGFADDFSVEIPSSYDFVVAHGLRTSIMSFGYALERPQARGGQENLTLNIIIHRDLFPLVQSFQKAIQRKVHALHDHMDKNPDDKDTIRKQVFAIRKYVSSIILSYERIYGTTELIEEEN